MKRIFGWTRLLAVPLLFAAVSKGGLAPGAEAAPAGDCAIAAWSKDRSPSGLPMRAKPDASAAIVGMLPPPIEVEGQEIAVEVGVAASRDGWFLVREAAYRNYGDKAKARIVRIEQPGWVPGAQLGVQIDAGEVRAQPSPAAPVVSSLVVRLPNGEAWTADEFAIQRLTDCKGGWVALEGKWPNGTPVQGWVERVCSDQQALCPSPLRGQHRSD